MNIPSHDILQLFLLESTFENETVRPVYRPICTQFREKIVFEMVERTVETDRHVVDVGKDGTFGTFAEDERWGKCDFFAESKRGVIFSKDSKHSMEQLESLGIHKLHRRT
jgi:hypothetical protein